MSKFQVQLLLLTIERTRKQDSRVVFSSRMDNFYQYKLLELVFKNIQVEMKSEIQKLEHKILTMRENLVEMTHYRIPMQCS